MFEPRVRNPNSLVAGVVAGAIYWFLRKTWFGLDLAVVVGYSVFVWFLVYTKDDNGEYRIVPLPRRAVVLWHAGYLILVVGMERAARLGMAPLQEMTAAQWRWQVALPVIVLTATLAVAQFERQRLLRKPKVGEAIASEAAGVAEFELWLLAEKAKKGEHAAVPAECEQMLREQAQAKDVAKES